MSPLKMMQITSALNQFQINHPKFMNFWKAVRVKGLREDTVLELKLTTPEGEQLVTNIKVTAEDLKLLQQLQEIAVKP